MLYYEEEKTEESINLDESSNARAQLYPLQVEVKIQRRLPRGGRFIIHSFLFQMPHWLGYDFAENRLTLCG